MFENERNHSQMRKVKKVKTIEDLQAEFDSHEPFTSYQRFMAQALMFIAEHVSTARPAKDKSKPTEWQKFFAKGMRAGKSPAQVAKEWHERPKLRKIA